MRLFNDRRGAAAVEFALIAPAFLMFIFLIIDGGRMLFTRQALTELASATARCAALKATGCTDAATAATWAQTRAQRSAGMLSGATAVVLPSTTCNGQASMAQATVSLTYKRGAMNLLPQSMSPSTMTAISCFPTA